MDRKITLVGGGSYAWSPRLIADMMREEALSGSEICLYDICIKAAEEVRAAAERFLADHVGNFRVTVTNRESEAFAGADAVIITISTGGLDAMRFDVELPDKYGIYQSTGDSVGPGGWSRALRNVPVFAKMARTIEKLAPRAFVLNYTNPMAVLTGTFYEVSGLRTLGLCHGPVGTLHYLATILETDVSRMKAIFGGVNHFFWITDFTVDGKDGYQMLQDRLAGRDLTCFDKSNGGVITRDHTFLAELYHHLGYLTYTAADHVPEFLPNYLHDPEIMRRFGINRKTMDGRQTAYHENHRKVLDMAAGKVPMPEKSIEVAVNVLKALFTGETFCDVVNLPNVGQIDNLPRKAVVETMGQISGRGFSPICAGNLPSSLVRLVEPHCRVQLMTLEAALTGNKKLAMEALMMDPLCGNLPFSDVVRMGEELMEANRQWLPQFH